MKAQVTRMVSIDSHGASIDGHRLALPDFQPGPSILRTIYRSMRIAYPKFFKMDLLSRLGFLSAEMLLSGTGLIERHSPERCGIFLMNCSSSLDTDEKHQETISDPSRYFPSPSVFVYTLPNIMVGEIAIRHGIKGENAVFISGEPDPDLLWTVADEAFRHERITAAMVGWIEAWHDNLQASILLAETGQKVISSPEKRENVIFDAQKIKDLLHHARSNG